MTIVALASLLLRLLFDRPALPFVGHVLLVSVLIPSYLAFCPAIACALYSLLFEALKQFAVLGIVFAILSGLLFPMMLDSVLLLPFAFLAVMGVVKFVRWRTEKSQAHQPKTV